MLSVVFLCMKEWYHSSFVGQNTVRADFVKMVEASVIERYYEHEQIQYITADQIIMALALVEKVKRKSVQAHCEVVTTGDARGMMIVDWKNFLNKQQNAEIITDLDDIEYQSLLISALS